MDILFFKNNNYKTNFSFLKNILGIRCRALAPINKNQAVIILYSSQHDVPIKNIFVRFHITVQT